MADTSQLAERMPVKVTGNGTVISGHARLAAAAIAGEQIPVALGTREERLDAGEEHCNYCGALAWDVASDGHDDGPYTHGPVIDNECGLCKLGREAVEAEAP